MIDYDLFKNIENYANRHLESSKELYTLRNQSTDKLHMNILNGKIAEYCCYYSMQSAGYILENKPDLEIYSANNKTHDADLICTGKNDKLYAQPKHIHIKSVSLDTYKKYGASFLVEKSNKLIKYPDENHYYSVMLQESLLVYKFHAWLPTLSVRYDNPVNNLPSKLAVYIK